MHIEGLKLYSGAIVGRETGLCFTTQRCPALFFQ